MRWAGPEGGRYAEAIDARDSESLLVLTVLTGLLYPGVVTGLCQLLFRQQANGSLIVKDGQVVGSSLIGQNFTRPEYFHPRPFGRRQRRI